MIILGLMEAADVDEDEPPADVVERLCAIGINRARRTVAGRSPNWGARRWSHCKPRSNEVGCRAARRQPCRRVATPAALPPSSTTWSTSIDWRISAPARLAASTKACMLLIGLACPSVGQNEAASTVGAMANAIGRAASGEEVERQSERHLRRDHGPDCFRLPARCGQAERFANVRRGFPGAIARCVRPPPRSAVRSQSAP